MSKSEFAAPDKSAFLGKRLRAEDNEPQESPTAREPFQRDRDRIIHSRAFRRLMHKTQVFNANYGDHYRNRLTHTLEVCQISRSIGKALGLNDTLIEAIALGHDLGHTPFGHIGERTLHGILNKSIAIDGLPCMDEGFKHNFQGLQVIDNIESVEFERNGMNLTLAVREGILKHTETTIKYNGNKEIVRYSALNLEDIDINSPSFTLEGQVVAIADEIAQCTHDLEDGVRANIISVNDIVKDQLVSSVMAKEGICESQLKTTLDVRTLIVRNLVGTLIKDVYKASKDKITNFASQHNNMYPKFRDSSDVYHEQLICYSPPIAEQTDNLSKAISNIVVQSQQISQSDAKSEYIITQLFKAYFKHPKQLPDYILKRYCRKTGQVYSRKDLKDEQLRKDHTFIRMICDHIACMTDQYAEREYKKLYVPDYV